MKNETQNETVSMQYILTLMQRNILKATKHHEICYQNDACITYL